MDQIMEKTKIDFEADGDWVKRLLFANIFINENKLQTVFDRYHVEVTSKQWLLLAVANSFIVPPTLTEVGEAMGCSRQNVKKIAVLLEQKGYIKLTKDEEDGRILRIVITQKFIEYSATLEERNSKVLEVVFKEFTKEQLDVFYENNEKLGRGIKALDAYFASVQEGEKK